MSIFGLELTEILFIPLILVGLFVLMVGWRLLRQTPVHESPSEPVERLSLGHPLFDDHLKPAVEPEASEHQDEGWYDLISRRKVPPPDLHFAAKGVIMKLAEQDRLDFNPVTVNRGSYEVVISRNSKPKAQGRFTLPEEALGLGQPS